MAKLKPRLEEFECPASILPADDGEEPLRATVRINLTFEELDALPKGDQMPYVDIREAIAPFITAWNWTATDDATGEDVPVPPPAEAGPDALRTMTRDMVMWLFNIVRLGFQGGDRRKTPSLLPDDTDVPGSESIKANGKRSRKRQGS